MRLFTERTFIIRTAGLFLAIFFLIASKGYAGEWKGIRFTPYLGVSETYSDNVTFQSNDPLDDFITSLNAGLKAHYETPLSEFDLAGIIHYNIYASHDEFDNVSGDITAGWKQELTKYDRFRLRNSYVHSDEPYTFSDAFNTRAGRITYEVNTLQLGYEHDFTSQLTGTARYANQLTFFSSELYRNTSMNTGGPGMIYHLDSKTDLLFNYDYEVREFDHGNTANDHILAGGVRRYFTEWIYFDGKVGVDFIDPYVGGNINEPRFEAKLTDEINPTTTVDIAFEKNYSLNAYIEDVFDHWQVSSSLKKEWTERLRSYASIFYGSGEYVINATENDLIGASISLTYDLTKAWKTELKYSFTDISSSDVTQEYTVNLISLGLTRDF